MVDYAVPRGVREAKPTEHEGGSAAHRITQRGHAQRPRARTGETRVHPRVPGSAGRIAGAPTAPGDGGRAALCGPGLKLGEGADRHPAEARASTTTTGAPRRPGAIGDPITGVAKSGNIFATTRCGGWSSAVATVSAGTRPAGSGTCGDPTPTTVPISRTAGA